MVLDLYRDRYELYLVILREAKRSGAEGIKFTSLMYRTYMSFQQMTDTANFLVDNGMLIVVENKFFITDKGREFYDIIQQMNELVVFDRLS